MQGRRHLHRVTIGRTRELRGPDALERLAVAFISFVVMVLAFWFGLHQIRMVKTIGAINLTSVPKDNLILYRAVHGAWPPPSDEEIIAENNHGPHVKNIALEPGGGLTAEMALLPDHRHAQLTGSTYRQAESSGFLSFRTELIGARGYPAAILLCGYAKPISKSPRIQSENKTTSDRSDLPPVCR